MNHLERTVTGAKRFVRTRFPDLYFAAQNTARNRRLVGSGERFLVVRHRRHPWGYELLLKWLERKFPELRAHFELRSLPCRVRDWSRYVLHVPWLQDPVQQWSPTTYERARRLAAQCDAHGVPIINRVERLPNAGKSHAARVLADLGIRTARMHRIDDVAEFKRSWFGMTLPLIVREDWGHGGVIVRADTPDEVRRLPVEDFLRPVAVEFIDARSERDGLYRKYRYLAVGDEGIALHLHVSRAWVTKGTNCEDGETYLDEEHAYLRGPHPHHDLLQRAREALGLDFVGFDYGYDGDGRLVVWEANPFPFLHFPKSVRRQHRAPPLERALAAMTRLYLDRAGLPIPDALQEYLTPIP